MGKSSKPLRILSIGYWSDFLIKLIDQGHTVDKDEPTLPLTEYDIVWGPTCWLMDSQHEKYEPLAITEARKKRYPKDAV